MIFQVGRMGEKILREWINAANKRNKEKKPEKQDIVEKYKILLNNSIINASLKEFDSNFFKKEVLL